MGKSVKPLETAGESSDQLESTPENLLILALLAEELSSGGGKGQDPGRLGQIKSIDALLESKGKEITEWLSSQEGGPALFMKVYAHYMRNPTIRELLVWAYKELQQDGAQRAEETAAPSQTPVNTDDAVETGVRLKGDDDQAFTDENFPIGDFFKGEAGFGYDPIPNKPSTGSSGSLPKVDCPNPSCVRGCMGERMPDGTRHCIGP